MPVSYLRKLIYWNSSRDDSTRPHVLANREKIKLLAVLVGCFFFSGMIGALGFKHVGFISTLPLAILLLILALMPVLDDIGLVAG